MARQSNGTYVQPANTAAVSGQSISSANFNTLVTDIGSEITNSLDRNGRSAMTAALPMGNNKVTGMADPTVSTDAATKNYTDNLVGSFFSTGDVKLTYKTVADTGWIMFADAYTIGAVGSGANFASISAQALFTLLYNNVSDTWAPLLNTTGATTTRASQGTASAAWAAGVRLTLPVALGRSLALAGTGTGLSQRFLGQNIGAESYALTTANLPPYTPSGTVSTTTTGTIAMQGFAGTGGAVTGASSSGSSNGGAYTNPITASSTSTFTGSAQGGTAASFSLYQPTVYLNAMVKL